MFRKFIIIARRIFSVTFFYLCRGAPNYKDSLVVRPLVWARTCTISRQISMCALSNSSPYICHIIKPKEYSTVAKLT